MREVDVKEVTAAVAKLCKDSCYYLPEELLKVYEDAVDKEESEMGKGVLQLIVDNAKLAKSKDVPICQDTGLAVVY
ncbi:MAG: fumarate hydratase, partial [Phascolarctobacterium sp.]|nr:fumarate hydratase [Candidatus Phascolarctobacterium equi]